MANPESAVVVAGDAGAVVGGVVGGGAACAAAVVEVEPVPLGAVVREDDDEGDELHATRTSALVTRTPNSRNRRPQEPPPPNPNIVRILAPPASASPNERSRQLLPPHVKVFHAVDFGSIRIDP